MRLIKLLLIFGILFFCAGASSLTYAQNINLNGTWALDSVQVKELDKSKKSLVEKTVTPQDYVFYPLKIVIDSEQITADYSASEQIRQTYLSDNKKITVQKQIVQNRTDDEGQCIYEYKISGSQLKLKSQYTFETPLGASTRIEYFYFKSY